MARQILNRTDLRADHDAVQRRQDEEEAENQNDGEEREKRSQRRSKR